MVKSKNQLKTNANNRPLKKKIISSVKYSEFNRLQKKLTFVIAVLLFCSMGYLFFKFTYAANQYATGQITSVSGGHFNTDKFVRKEDPQIYIARCGKPESCTYRWFFVPPIAPAGKQWTSYKLTSTDNANYTPFVQTKVDQVNAKYDTIVTSNKNNFGYHYLVQYFGPNIKSSKSRVLAMPKNPENQPLPKPETTQPTPPAPKPPTPPTPKPPTPPAPKPTPPAPKPPTSDPDDENDNQDGEDWNSDDVSDSGGTDSFEIDFDVSDLEELGLSEADLYEFADDDLSDYDPSSSDDYQLSDDKIVDKSAETQGPSLAAHGFKARLFCVKKIDKKGTYKNVDCQTADTLFLAVGGADKTLAKDQLKYKVVVPESKVRFSEATGCTNKKLQFGSQEVNWCAVVFKEKSVVNSLRDSFQNRVRQIFSRINKTRYIDLAPTRVKNLAKNKSDIKNKQYAVVAKKRGYASTVISRGSMRFDTDSAKVEKLITLSKKTGCKTLGNSKNIDECVSGSVKTTSKAYNSIDDSAAQKLLLGQAKTKQR